MYELSESSAVPSSSAQTEAEVDTLRTRRVFARLIVRQSGFKAASGVFFSVTVELSWFPSESFRQQTLRRFTSPVAAVAIYIPFKSSLLRDSVLVYLITHFLSAAG